MTWRQTPRPNSVETGSVIPGKQSRMCSSVLTESESKQACDFEDLQRDWQGRPQECFLQNADHLLWYAMVVTGDPDSALDCLMEALDEACAINGGLPEPAMEWSKALVIRLAIRKMYPLYSAFAHEDQKIKDFVEKNVERIALPTPEKASLLLGHLTNAALLPNLFALNCFHRTVYLLRILEGWTRVDTASILQMPEGIIESAERSALLLFTDVLLTTASQQSSGQRNHEDPLPCHRSFLPREANGLLGTW